MVFVGVVNVSGFDLWCDLMSLFVCYWFILLFFVIFVLILFVYNVFGELDNFFWMLISFMVKKL